MGFVIVPERLLGNILSRWLYTALCWIVVACSVIVAAMYTDIIIRFSAKRIKKRQYCVSCCSFSYCRSRGTHLRWKRKKNKFQNSFPRSFLWASMTMSRHIRKRYGECRAGYYVFPSFWRSGSILTIRATGALIWFQIFDEISLLFLYLRVEKKANTSLTLYTLSSKRLFFFFFGAVYHKVLADPSIDLFAPSSTGATLTLTLQQHD